MISDDEKIVFENSNLPRELGALDLHKFKPFHKNPPISKVFREIGLADELGSGMRNTYKYTQLYSGKNTLFVEENIFKTTIPLKKIATQKVGPVMDIVPLKIENKIKNIIKNDIKESREKFKIYKSPHFVFGSEFSLAEESALKSSSWTFSMLPLPNSSSASVRSKPVMVIS